MKISNFKYIFAFLPVVAIYISLMSKNEFSWFALVFLFAVLPFIEFFTKGSMSNISEKEEKSFKDNKFFDLLLFTIAFTHFFFVYYFLKDIQTNFEQYSWGVTAGHVSAMALANGLFGINLAHELGHRKNKFYQFLSISLLSTSLYVHFFIEHNKNHHKNVSTPLDHASAEKGVNLYVFLLRSLTRSFEAAFRTDAKSSFKFISVEVILVTLIFYFFGINAGLLFLIAALGGILLLESVNYIEHYGLRRKKNPNTGKFEKVMPKHSWNSNHPISRVVLLELSRHSDHHANADRPYQLLRHFDDSPQLPTGYPGMILLATIPPLWFKVMDTRLPE